jgi:hypothetical protein
MIVRILEEGDFKCLIMLARTRKGMMSEITAIVRRLDASHCAGGIPSQLISTMPCLQQLLVPQGPEHPLPALTAVDPKVLEALVKLRELDVSGMKVMYNTMEGIARCTQLASLTLDGCRGARDEDIITNHLTVLTNLRKLHMNGIGLGVGTLKMLRGATNIETLVLDGSHGCYLNEIGSLRTSLRVLRMNGFRGPNMQPSVSDAHKTLNLLTGLTELELGNTRAFTRLDADSITALGCLERLVASQCMWSQRLLIGRAPLPEHVCSLTNLKHLDLSYNGMAPGSPLILNLEAHVYKLVKLEVMLLGGNGLAPHDVPLTAAHMHSRGELRV